MLNVVLVAPEIASNTGNIGRTCVVTGSRLHLVGPLGFSLDDRMLCRAGLAYWRSLDVRTYDDWDVFLRTNGLAGSAGVGDDPGSGPDPGPDDARLHLLTKKARRTYAEARYADGDYLVFGCESVGLPEGLLAAHPTRCERIPMLPDAASLSNAAEWRAAAAGRASTGGGGDAAGDPGASSPSPLARDVCGNFVDPDDWRVSALNLSNAAAIVLYEALRQLGYPGMQA